MCLQMIMRMPKWYVKAERQLDEMVDNIIRDNCIDWRFSHDSQTLNDAKETILQTLVRIDEQVKNPMNMSAVDTEKFLNQEEKK